MARQLEPACSHSSQTCYGASSQPAAVRGLKRAECNYALQAGGACAKEKVEKQHVLTFMAIRTQVFLNVNEYWFNVSLDLTKEGLLKC